MKMKILNSRINFLLSPWMALAALVVTGSSCMRILMNPYSVAKKLQKSGEFSFSPRPESMYFLIPIKGASNIHSDLSATLKVDVDGSIKVIKLNDLAALEKTNWLNSEGIGVSVIAYSHQFQSLSKISKIKYSLTSKSGDFELWVKYLGIRGKRPTMTSRN